MTEEQQRIAIAEACGWAVSDLWAWDGQTCYEREQDVRVQSKLPDYLHDLNAQFEAWKTLTECQKLDFAMHVERIALREVIWMKEAEVKFFGEIYLSTISKWIE